ncbi:MAG: glycosyltransferase family 4 protein [Candidatus Solibacter usitatus]|nr:glycosyltransferase family 4 protein [Candidatus Solibacter usitatus]
MRIALDATYSLGEHLSGVGVYSQELLRGLARAHPEQRFQWCYRAHRYLRSFAETPPPNCRRALLQEPWLPLPRAFFHGLNQRLPAMRFRKTVATFHDLFVLTGDYSTPEFRRRFAEQARHAAAESDLIIAVSQFTAGQVQQHLGVEPERIHVIHHGARAPAGPAPTACENVILNVGAIQRRKNIGRLVNAFEQIAPGWQLVLAGSAGYGAEEILRQIELSPRRDSIRVLGYVGAAELASWYARARVFAFPSLDEGFGMPVLDAMAAGVPVVASNRSAVPEVCGTAALLVDPEDTAALAQALDQVIQNEGLAGDLIARGRRRAAEFTWEQAAVKTWKVYEKLLEKP